MTEVILIAEEGQADWDRVGESIRHGNLACLPSDTIYGIACDPLSSEAIGRIFAAKGRRREKPLALVFSDVEQAYDLLPDVGTVIRDAINALLPGPVTVIVPAMRGDAQKLSANLGSPGSIGIRVIPPPLDEVFRRLPTPLALTSANLSGSPAPRSFGDVPREVLDVCDYAIDAGPCPVGMPSTVIDLRPLASGGPAHILREGAVSRREAGELLA